MNKKGFIALALAALGLTSGCRSFRGVCIYGGPSPEPPDARFATTTITTIQMYSRVVELKGRITFSDYGESAEEAGLMLYYNGDFLRSALTNSAGTFNFGSVEIRDSNDLSGKPFQLMIEIYNPNNCDVIEHFVTFAEDENEKEISVKIDGSSLSGE